MRERGLKFAARLAVSCRFRVAPHAGAWIEIMNATPTPRTATVAPHAGAWNEICQACPRLTWRLPLLIWERELTLWH